MLKVLDLFSGIGGFSLGLERTGGFQTVAFCEIEPYCRKVLAKHWPGVPIYEDVRELTADTLARDGIAVDVICGGFPCQDISCAGKGAGIEGSRSGLWSEYARLIGELRPRFVIVENVAMLLNRGMGTVLGDLATLGYDAQWDCIPASAVGAPHRRDRVWIVANARQRRCSGAQNGQVQQPGRTEALGTSDVSNPASKRCREAGQLRERPKERTASSSKVLAHAKSDGPEEHEELWPDNRKEGGKRTVKRGGGRETLANASEQGDGRLPRSRRRFWCEGDDPRECGRGNGSANVQWATEPNVGRVANGVPNRVDRLKALGNAVVPQIPELIGRAILEAETT